MNPEFDNQTVIVGSLNTTLSWIRIMANLPQLQRDFLLFCNNLQTTTQNTGISVKLNN